VTAANPKTAGKSAAPRFGRRFPVSCSNGRQRYCCRRLVPALGRQRYTKSVFPLITHAYKYTAAATRTRRVRPRDDRARPIIFSPRTIARCSRPISVASRRPSVVVDTFCCAHKTSDSISVVVTAGKTCRCTVPTVTKRTNIVLTSFYTRFRSIFVFVDELFLNFEQLRNNQMFRFVFQIARRFVFLRTRHFRYTRRILNQQCCCLLACQV